MEQVAVKDEKSYKRILGAFARTSRKNNGLTAADVVARTALPIEKVKELLPVAADEYSARLRVTESGEILYTFPSHPKSRYKGIGVSLRRLWSAIRNGVKKVSVAVFKVWIMVMLVGYFVLFMLIALAALVLSMAGSSQNNSSRRDSGGGVYLFSSVLNMIIRIWFYSELAKSFQGDYYGNRGRPARPKGKPLYKAIFSFVFGDGDPNMDIEDRERQAFIAYIQANDGVISLPEFMTITGAAPLEADGKILEYCARFGGSPEATEDGTVVYVFRELLLRTDKRGSAFSGFSAPLRRLRSFSSNEKKLNVWFGIINTVNLLFGGYFLYNALNTGIPTIFVTGTGRIIIHNLYEFTCFAAQHFLQIQNPLPVITYMLGAVPLAFSAFFWLIPAIRSRFVKKENEKIKLRNLRKTGYKTILDKRLEVRASDITAPAQCSPSNFETKREDLLKEIGGYSQPSVTVDPLGEPVYVFNALDDEVRALQKFRLAESKNTAGIGKVIFDSGV
ncbi:MAG: hypothetical protein LBG72_08370 [Spirochaetaceae bacterium]|jgi:hypothetical protein|nr:hypothetical protein [Spirochaetaceae bacterium]